MNLASCHCCGLIHRIPEYDPGSRVICTRCGSSFAAKRDSFKMRSRVAALTLSSLALFPAAVLLPIVEVQRLGHHHRSSILGGIWELFAHGSIFIGSVILLFSIVFPLAKLIALLELSWLGALGKKHRAWTYRWMELAGKWSMMDVMLLALLVMFIKLSGLVEFHFGPAVVAFTACVALSLLAALAFDPHGIWEST
ncbi:MAG: paraquat-inducible protein A [Planctomycetes bacterium]|nr:paraquat-inducible protein A [Planctomycetota bacterium]